MVYIVLYGMPSSDPLREERKLRALSNLLGQTYTFECQLLDASLTPLKRHRGDRIVREVFG